jgi:hypothetical protein
MYFDSCPALLKSILLSALIRVAYVKFFFYGKKDLTVKIHTAELIAKAKDTVQMFGI